MLDSMRPVSVVVGAGEIGNAIYTLLSGHYPVFLYDVIHEGDSHVPECNFLHICFPYTQKVFEDEVRRYRKMFRASHVVIHSTVPVGVSASLFATHSPVRGKHYDMLRSLRTYTKFFAGPEAGAAAQIFLRIGVPVMVYGDQGTTELAKILETTFLGLLVRWTQVVDLECGLRGLSFTEVWDKFTSTYNEACGEFGQPPFPVLTPIHEKIGGHCVLPNLAFLPAGFPFLEILKGGDV